MKPGTQNNEITEAARQADLVGYFRRSGYSLQQHGKEFYVKEFPGLCINSGTNAWYDHYSGTGGYNAVDCLTKICKRDFLQAVSELTGQDISKKASQNSVQTSQKNPVSDKNTQQNFSTQSKEKSELKMPEHAENMRRVFAYLCQSRKIPAEIVNEFIKENLLYQSQETVTATVKGIPQTFKNCNAVFVHKNKNGETVGGEIQGVNSFKRYKGLAAGTGESVFTFTPKLAKSGAVKKAYLFESAIDLMSFYAFCDKKKLVGTSLISMAGLKPAVPKKLQSEGVEIISCVDNDAAGKRFETENNFNRPSFVKQHLDGAGFKDWNELLTAKSQTAAEEKSIAPEAGKKHIFGGNRQ
jgi:hypothetical protein